MASDAAANSRLPPIPIDQWTEEQQKAAAEFRATRGYDIRGPFVPLFRSPELMIRTAALGQYLRYGSALPQRLSEFVILLTARHCNQDYEWSVHYPDALAAGIDPATVSAIAEGKRPQRMTDDEAALYDVCENLLRTQRVSDAAYVQAVSRLGERGLVDTIGIVGYYTLLGMVLNTARVQAQADAPALPSLKQG
jgi:4-carboxymuconolactone decarboxylase